MTPELADPDWGPIEYKLCVTCPGCAFSFGAEHTDNNCPPDESHYSCPICEQVDSDEKMIKPQILILDDRVDIAEALAGTLEWVGFTVTVATSYEETTQYIQLTDYAAVICDYDLGLHSVGDPGDELMYLAIEAPTHNYELICFSGLERPMPNNVIQFSKGDPLALRDYLAEKYLDTSSTTR